MTRAELQKEDQSLCASYSNAPPGKRQPSSITAAGGRCSTQSRLGPLCSPRLPEGCTALPLHQMSHWYCLGTTHNPQAWAAPAPSPQATSPTEKEALQISRLASKIPPHPHLPQTSQSAPCPGWRGGLKRQQKQLRSTHEHIRNHLLHVALEHVCTCAPLSVSREKGDFGQDGTARLAEVRIMAACRPPTCPRQPRRPPIQPC